MLTLERADLLQLEPISNRGTLKLLPLGKKNKQKLVIGDDSGQISCYEFKKGEPQVVFQTKVFEGPVTCVALGGNPQKRDKIFLSHSQRIVGLTKKGKEFFKLTSSLTETIQSIAVEDTRIWTGCEHIYNLFDNGKDAAYYVAKGQINDLVVSHLTKENDFDAILACQDKYLRIIHGSQLYLEIPVTNPVTAIWHLEMDSELLTPMASRPRYLLYGTSSGEVGLVQVGANASYEVLWELADEGKAEVTCLTAADVNKDGVPEVMVGRGDGRLEVLRLAPENILIEPTLVFSKDIGQSIRSVVCGAVNTAEYLEVIVAAYSGKVISFTTEPLRARAAEDSYGRSIATVNNENRIRFLRKEVEELKKKLDKDKEKVKKMNLPVSMSSSMMASKTAAVDLAVSSKFFLDAALGAYALQLELQVPMDLVLLQCPVLLDLVTPDTSTSSNTSSADSSSAAMSVTPEGVVLRCQANERRVSLLLRSNEGEHGDLVITVVSASAPKAAKVLKYELKPLSLHAKVHRLTPEEVARPKHRIRYTGAMSLSTIHEWLDGLLPDLPSRGDEEAEAEGRHVFRNAFTCSVLSVEYRKGELCLESESASTIAIAKETVTRLANYRRVPLEETVTPSEPALLAFLGLLKGKLDEQAALSRRILLVDAVQELAQLPPDYSADTSSGVQPAPGSWLSEECRGILAAQESIRAQAKTRTRSLQHLAGIVTDVFVDYHRIQGIDAKHHIGALQALLMNMSGAGYFSSILAFFTSSK